MKLLDIVKQPTVIDNIHESMYRSFHILNKVIELLEAKTPPAVTLEIIETLRSAPHIETTMKDLDD